MQMNQSRVTQLAVPVTRDDHVDGPADSPVTFVEYGDYECPYCEEAYQAVTELRRTMSDDVQFVFRHFPLTQLHPHAQRAAEAAEAAGAQGAFWEMHELLFENADALTEADLRAYAATLDLDVDRFRDELETNAHLDRIEADLVSGSQSGVVGTPTFFINGARYDEQWDSASLRVAIEDAR